MTHTVTHTTESSRKTVAVAILALMIAVGALTTRTVHIVTAPAIASGLFKSL